MKITVKLFALARLRAVGYDHEKGLELEFPDNARIYNLLGRLEIRERGVLVAKNKTQQRWDSILEEGAIYEVHLIPQGG